MTPDILELFKTVFGAGLGSAIAQTSLSIWQDRTKRKDNGGYLAMRISVILESFAFECAAQVEANQSAEHRPGEEFPDWNITIPSIGEYPAELDGWRYLDRNLADRCLRLPSSIVGSRQTIAFIADIATGELGDRANIEISDRGIEAWQLACDLRQRFRLDERAPLGWDFSSSLVSAGARARSNMKAEEQKREKLQSQIAVHWDATRPNNEPASK